MRQKIDDDVVADYAASYKAKVKMPQPVIVFDPATKSSWVADGMHRITAAMQIKLKAIPCDVITGTYEDCVKLALSANQTHGLRRSNKDKRQCVSTAIKTWPDISNRHIAEMMGVDDKTVGTIRKELEEECAVAPTPVRTGKDDKKQSSEKKDSEPSGAEIPHLTPQKSKKKEIKDQTGYPIPSECLLVWNRSHEVGHILTALGNIKSVLVAARDDDDILYREVNFSTAISDLDKAWHAIQCALPYAVCTVCQGRPDMQPKGQCRMCKGRGMISKFRYDRTVPEEIKKVREDNKK